LRWIGISYYLKYNKLLWELEKNYPEIKWWFYDKVVPSINFWYWKILELENDGELIWFSILKNTIKEQKIRTITVLEKYQNKWYAVKLMKESIKELENDKPLYTVSEEFIDVYKKIWKHFWHKIIWILDSKYIPWKKEYVFNWGYQENNDYSTPFPIY